MAMDETDRLRAQISANLGLGLIAAAFAVLAGGAAGFASVADKLPSHWAISIGVLLSIASVLLLVSIVHGGRGQQATNQAIQQHPEKLVDNYDAAHFNAQAVYGALGLLLEILVFFLAAIVASWYAHGPNRASEHASGGLHRSEMAIVGALNDLSISIRQVNDSLHAVTQGRAGTTTNAHLELLGYVGPFRPGQDRSPEDSTIADNPTLCRCGHEKDIIQEIRTRTRHESLVGLFIVGSADTFELHGSSRREYGSNMGLARARADWVSGQLKSSGILAGDQSKVITMTVGPSVHGQPLNPKITAPDRNVAVFGLWWSTTSSSLN